MSKMLKLHLTLLVLTGFTLMGNSELQELIDISNKSELETIVEYARSRLVVLTFHAPFCDGCKDLVYSDDGLRRTAARYTEFAVFVAVNVDKTDGSFVNEYSYTELPTTIILKNGNRVSTIKKAKVDQVNKRIAENI